MQAAGVRRGLATVGVLAVLVAALVGFGRWVDQREHQRHCDALGASVEGMGPLHWENGITSTGAAWVNALTDGNEHADDETRAALAEAVRDDVAGFRDVQEAMGDDDGAAERLRAMLIDPDGPQARRTGEAVGRDVGVVRRAALECGLV